LASKSLPLAVVAVALVIVLAGYGSIVISQAQASSTTQASSPQPVTQATTRTSGDEGATIVQPPIRNITSSSTRLVLPGTSCPYPYVIVGVTNDSVRGTDVGSSYINGRTYTVGDLVSLQFDASAGYPGPNEPGAVLKSVISNTSAIAIIQVSPALPAPLPPGGSGLAQFTATVRTPFNACVAEVRLTLAIAYAQQ
jgi:hypothetical protein